jgi:hypothetical protein
MKGLYYNSKPTEKHGELSGFSGVGLTRNRSPTFWQILRIIQNDASK